MIKYIYICIIIVMIALFCFGFFVNLWANILFMTFRDKIAPTRDGFQELWDSYQDPTMEMLMAGIQSKRTTKEQILTLTGNLRNSHTLLDKELLRLGDFSKDYNSKWATKKTYTYGTAEELQAKSQSQLKLWRKMLKITTPRCPKHTPDATQPSIYKASYLTHQPYELDMWGPASYGTLIYDLFDEMNVLIDHLEDGKQLCKGVMQQEQEIDKNPEWKEELHDKQFQQIAEQNQDVIEKRYNEGILDTDNRIYKEMVSATSKLEFKSKGFHKYHERECVDYVVTVSTLKLQKNEITPVEHQLFGDNFGEIKLLHFVIEHLDDLLKIKEGKFNKDATVELIKFFAPKESTKRHEDSERILFEHIKENYKGSNKWYCWSSVFTLSKTVKQSVKEKITYSTRFERVLNRYLVEHGLKREDIAGESTEN
ncbi:MAG: hypothetical protein IKH37_04245 [Prevotella sp.]|nr:hypothetical protein [Prevotella sp.]